MLIPDDHYDALQQAASTLRALCVHEEIPGRHAQDLAYQAIDYVTETRKAWMGARDGA